MRKFGKVVLIGAMALLFATGAARQIAAQESRAPIPLAVGDKVYFGGFISDSKVPSEVRIIGSLNEANRYLMTKGERVYINKGRSQGAQVGEVYQILRPLGPYYHPFKTRQYFFYRRGDMLGYFNDETGLARIIAVQDNTSTAELIETYNDVRLGDVLIPFQKRTLPEQRPYVRLDPFAAPTGKTGGQIIFARAEREQLTTSDVVIIDLGQKAGVKVGDYFTIYREQNSESVNHFRDDEVAMKRFEGASSYRFGGNSGNNYSLVHPSLQKEKIVKLHPGKTQPRTVVGELVIIRVEGNTANAVITRTQSGEVFMGDRVELQ